MKYIEKDLVRVAKRENNTKRNYLVVNPLQGKHVPASPSGALQLFEALANEIKGKYENERLLVVGFAETATAIGAQVAISLGTKYIQTTREIISDVGYLYFSEAHSHATEQKLVKEDIDSIINEVDRIVFVEDEVTTGNTIMNIIRVIQEEYAKELSFSLVSLLNGMTKDYLDIYSANEISLFYLVKTEHSGYGAIADLFAGDGEYVEANRKEAEEIHQIDITGKMNARRLVDASAYEKACYELAGEVIDRITFNKGENVLVIGNEEFMYPALLVGSEIEKTGCTVKCHSTTRSPIAVSNEENYPLHCRYALDSLYDSKRRVYLYDIGQYDRVVVVTDSKLTDSAGLNTLLNALKTKNNNISVVRWC